MGAEYPPRLHIVHINRYTQHGREGDKLGPHMAVDRNAVVRAPICHDAVHVGEGPVPGELGHKPAYG